MSARYFLFFLGVCQSAILRSKDLLTEISCKFFTPSDLLKTGLVDTNWIGIEKVFEKITPNAGLFEHKDTKEIIFETKENSWSQIELAEQFGYDAQERILIEKDIESRNWNNLYREYSRRQYSSLDSPLVDLLKALAEIIEVNAVDENQRTSIHWAANYDNIGLMEILLKRSRANPSLKDEWGDTSLHYAANIDGFKMIKLLLDHGAEIDAVGFLLRTPLMAAVNWGRCDAAKILLDHKANPNVRWGDGETALDNAVNHFGGNIDLVKLLLKHRAEGNLVLANKLKTTIKLAKVYGDWNSARIILSHQVYQFVKMLLKSKQYQNLIMSSLLVLLFLLFSSYR